MTDLERLGLAMIGFAIAIIVGGVLLGLIGATLRAASRTFNPHSTRPGTRRSVRRGVEA